MEISKPSLLEIKGILDFWNGKGMSGGLVSTADFSLEVGNPWKDPETGEMRGSLRYSYIAIG